MNLLKNKKKISFNFLITFLGSIFLYIFFLPTNRFIYAETSPRLTIKPPTITLNTGEIKKLNIFLQHTAKKKITSYQIVLSFDSRYISIVDLGADLPSGWKLTSSNITGSGIKKVTAVIYKVQGEVILKETKLLSFKAKALNTVGSTILRFDNDPLMGTIVSDEMGNKVEISFSDAKIKIIKNKSAEKQVLNSGQNIWFDFRRIFDTLINRFRLKNL